MQSNYILLFLIHINIFIRGHRIFSNKKIKLFNFDIFYLCYFLQEM